LYFYGTDHEIENRLKQLDKLDYRVRNQLIKILRVNPYSWFFRNLRNVEELEDQQIIIRSDPNLDQRVFNAPTSPRVAAIWVETMNV